MNFGILAAGEGSRLAGEGAKTPKPLIPINGVPMIERLIRIFIDCGADSVCVVINDFMPEVRQFLDELRPKLPVELLVKVKTTPSSMHTFSELSSMLKGKGRFIATTVDTIFRPADFLPYVEAFATAPEDVDGMMAVTDFVDDEKPLWVGVDSDLDITAFRDQRAADTPYVSGGIYGLDSRAVDVLDKCMASGVSRMRNYQRALVEDGLNLKAFPMGKIIDVDHVGDISKAEAFLS